VAETGHHCIVHTEKWLCGDCHLTITQSQSLTSRQMHRCTTSSPDRHLYGLNSDVEM